MRVLLLHNPTATTTSPALVDLIAGALAADVKLDVEATKRRDHAGYLAAGAAHEDYHAVVVLGGDGTVNEVVQGLAGTPVRLGVIPGGSTNVYARILGFANDPVEAAVALRASLRADRTRTVNLGRAGERLFAFHAGFGFDAAVVRTVEARARLKRTVRQASFLYCGVLARYGSYDRATTMRVEVPGAEPVTGLKTVVCCNADPFTFLGRRPARLCPDADLDGGLDLLGTTKMSTTAMLRLVRAALTDGTPGELPFTRGWHDLDAADLVADRATPLQVDGDYVGTHERVELGLVERALTVMAA